MSDAKTALYSEEPPIGFVTLNRPEKLNALNPTVVRELGEAVDAFAHSANGRVEWMVYSRGGEPCRKCGTRIERRAQGPDARLTYLCPKCQRTSASSSSP